MAVQVEASASAKPQWRDLREWLERVEAIGELQTVRGATSEEDIGAITEMVDHAAESPAVLFDDIPGFEPGYRVLVNGMGTRRRQAITLGLDPAHQVPALVVKKSSAVRVFVCCSPVRSTPRSRRYALARCATSYASFGAALVESSRIRVLSG